MTRPLFLASAFLLCFAGQALGQSFDNPFQVRAYSGLKPKDAITVTNTGASSTVASPQNGALCANAYALSATTGDVLDCCSCPVAPNALVSIPIIDDLLEHQKPKSKTVVIKVMATAVPQFFCDASAVGTGANVLVTGMIASQGETPFSPSTLSAAELTRLNGQCGAIHPGGTGCFACPIN
jgi:hypothetical protein